MADAKKDEKNPVKMMKDWLGTLKPEQVKAIEALLTPDQRAQFKKVSEAKEPDLADIKKFIGSLTPAQAAPIATKLTGPQITQVFAMKQLLK
jgi:hypothetical protein